MEYFIDDYDEMVSLYRNCSMTSKQDVIRNARFWKNKWSEQAKNDTRHSSAYYAVLDRMIDSFISKLENTVLFDAPDGMWVYNISISSEGIKLVLSHAETVDFEEEDGAVYPVYEDTDQTFTILTVNTKVLSIDEYAALYGVEPVTVRQWIRRGKLRTAKKYGGEWRIPELTEVTGRGYKPTAYEWDQELDNVPEEYAFLKSGNSIHILQDKDDKTKYSVNMGIKYKSLIDAKERERLELFLISHPLVRCTSDGFGNFA